MSHLRTDLCTNLYSTLKQTEITLYMLLYKMSLLTLFTLLLFNKPYGRSSVKFIVSFYSGSLTAELLPALKENTSDTLSIHIYTSLHLTRYEET